MVKTNQQKNSLAFRFSKVLFGGSSAQLRWRGCVSKVRSSLGFALGAAYVQKAFDKKAKSEISLTLYIRLINCILGLTNYFIRRLWKWLIIWKMTSSVWFKKQIGWTRRRNYVLRIRPREFVGHMDKRICGLSRLVMQTWLINFFKWNI